MTDEMGMHFQRELRPGDVAGPDVQINEVKAFFLEKEEDPRPLHLDDACSHFINYSQKSLQRNYKIV